MSAPQQGAHTRRVVLVTGACGAIGAAICRQFLQEGAHVFGADIRVPDGFELASQPNAEFRQLDVRSEAAVEWWVADAFAAGGQRVDVLVNCAAAFVFGRVEEVSEAQWDEVLGVNVKGYAFCTKHFLKRVQPHSGAAVVNVGSTSSFIAQPEFVPYNTSKGAVMQLTRCVALDAGRELGVRVNAVCPGDIRTPATLKHAEKFGVTEAAVLEKARKNQCIDITGCVDDVAHAVCFLADSEKSRFITGTSLMVDGGVTSM